MKAETFLILKKPQQYINVNDWSKAIGLKPLQCISRGEPLKINNETKPSPDSIWLFGIKKQQEYSIEFQIISVLDQIYPKRKEIKHIVEINDLTISLTTKAWFGEEDIFVDFGRDIFNKLIDLGASFQLTCSNSN